MRVKEATRKEIEQKFSEMNPYMGIEYLKGCLNNQLDFDTRKFALVKIAGLYEGKSMYLEAGKAMRAAGEINTSANAKIQDFIKAVELFIRGGDYEMADRVKKKAMALSDAGKRAEIERNVLAFYKAQAKVHIESNKRKQAVGIYERLLTTDIHAVEKKEIQEQLLALYESLGDFTRQRNLKRKMFN